jgi:O-antigen/teichoic acid export membrane protein
MNFIETIKNVAYSFGANLVSLAISAFMVMFVPKYLSVNDYGLWQLFLFYFSYLGFLHLGWEDGIYLRYADKKFNELDNKTFSGQFYGIILLQFLFAVLVTISSHYIVKDPVKQIALLCAVWLAPFVNFNNLCNFIMQITNRIKDYAKFLLTERIVFFLGVFIALFIFHKNEFWYMYYAKIVSMISITLIGIYLCRSLLRPEFYSIRDIYQEAKVNLSVGSKLMLANIAGMLIIGTVRYGISIGWDVATFGRVSLTLGISNFLMVFINSVSVVFFPLIKRMDETKRAGTYKTIRGGLDVILFAAIIGYYPLKTVLSWWLPKYADSLIYMNVLFPVCIFQSKLSLLVNTYLKSMRQEFLMLKINILAVTVSVITTFFTVKVFHNLSLAVFSIMFVYAFQCCLAEKCISFLLNIKLKKEIITDFVLSGIFIASGLYFQNVLCMVIYMIAYLMFLVLHKRQVNILIDIIKNRG